jgi:hypothetical protein
MRTQRCAPSRGSITMNKHRHTLAFALMRHRTKPTRSLRTHNTLKRQAVAIQMFADGTRRNDKPTQTGSYRHDANSMGRWADAFREGDVSYHFTRMLAVNER